MRVAIKLTAIAPAGHSRYTCPECRRAVLDSCDACEVYRCMRCHVWRPWEYGGAESIAICDHCFTVRVAMRRRAFTLWLDRVCSSHAQAPTQDALG